MVFGFLKSKAADLTGRLNNVPKEFLEGAAASVIYVAMADGSVSDEELQEGSDALRNFPGISDRFRASETDGALAKMEEHARRGRMGLVALKREIEEAGKKIGPEDKEMLIALCFNIAEKSGEIDAKEQAAIEGVAALLGTSAKL